jgi:hypothetical protein
MSRAPQNDPASQPPLPADPGCNGSIFRYSFDDGNGQGKILHSGPDSMERDTGTIHLSLDDGNTWPVKRIL